MDLMLEKLKTAVVKDWQGNPSGQNPLPTIKNDPKLFDFTLHEHKAQKAGCFFPGARILMADGSLKNIENIKKGEQVFTLLGPKNVLTCWNNGISLDWLEVTIGDISFICTPNHPFWVNDVGWVDILRLSNYKVGYKHGGLYLDHEDLLKLRKDLSDLRASENRLLFNKMSQKGKYLRCVWEEFLQNKSSNKNLQQKMHENIYEKCYDKKTSESFEPRLPGINEQRLASNKISSGVANYRTNLEAFGLFQSNGESGFEAFPNSFENCRTKYEGDKQGEIYRECPGAMGFLSKKELSSFGRRELVGEEVLYGGKNSNRDSLGAWVFQANGEKCLETSWIKISRQNFHIQNSSGEKFWRKSLQLEGRNLQQENSRKRGILLHESKDEKISHFYPREYLSKMWKRIPTAKTRSPSYNTIQIQLRQFFVESCSIMRKMSWNGGFRIFGHGSGEVRIRKLSGISGPRLDLEIQDAHHYFVEGFLVHNSHYDLRIGDPYKRVTYNWALRGMPEPGETKQLFSTGFHPYEYLNFKGKLTGYGAGQVDIARKEVAEVLSSNPEGIKFNLYTGRVPEQYVIHATGPDKWIIRNITPTRDSKPWKDLIPEGRPAYKEKKVDSVDLEDYREVAQPKIDGAHVLAVLRKGQIPRLFSYREAKSSPTGLIEHTFKVPEMLQERVPSTADNTTLRGELYGVDSKGRAVPASVLGGILNASTLKSRQMQEDKGIRLEFAPFQPAVFKSKKVDTLPYDKRQEILKGIIKGLPHNFNLLPTAETPSDKAQLLSKIQKGKYPLTREGIVLWGKEEPVVTKVKFKPEFDITVNDVFPSKHEGWAGGFTYQTEEGAEGRVGTGFSHKMREDMLANPDKYKGLVAKVESQEAFPSGILRAPAFKEWHLDKNDPQRLAKVSSWLDIGRMLGGA